MCNSEDREYQQLSLFDEIIEDTEIKEYKGWKWKELKFNLEGTNYGNE